MLSYRWPIETVLSYRVVAEILRVNILLKHIPSENASDLNFSTLGRRYATFEL